jgi:outer membrane lipoprotein-sorting protein
LAGTPCAGAQSQGALLREVLQRCAATYDGLRDYRGTIEREVWDNPLEVRRELIAVRFRRPSSLRLEWIEGLYRGTTVVAHAAWDPGALRIRLGGWFDFLTLRMPLTAVHEPFITATKDLSEWLSALSYLMRRSASERVLRSIRVRTEADGEGGQRAVLEVPAFLVPFQTDEAVMVYEIAVDLERWVPVELLLRGVGGEVRQRVRYAELEMNVGVPRRLFEAAKPRAGLEPEPPRDAELDLQQFFSNWQSRYGEITDYTGHLLLEERHRAGWRRQRLAFKFRKPFDLYLRDAAGVPPSFEALYRRGQNGDRVRVRVTRWGLPLIGDLDPQGYLALSRYHHPVTDFGLARLVERVQQEVLRAWLEEELGVRFAGVKRCDGRPCYEIEFYFPATQWRQYAYARIVTSWDIARRLPVAAEMYDWSGGLRERYTYSGLQVNVALTDRDFEASNPDYGFFLFRGAPWLDRFLTGRD